MIENINSDDILFVDVETVPFVSKFEEMSEPMQKLWEKKSKHLRDAQQTPSDVYERAGIYAEFGKIICISAGFLTGKTFRLKSVFGDDEKLLLGEFGSMVAKWSTRKDPYLCGHNVKEFDLPYVARRMIINRIKIPEMLNSAGKKPWEIKHLDTMELWKFGEYKNFTSLALLAEILEIPTPKDDIDGSMVARVYWEEYDINRIAAYCEKDVLTTARVLMRLMGRESIDDESVESLTQSQ
jgi:predicted PolB exonuclease-like 3'-5' exonuclease